MIKQSFQAMKNFFRIGPRLDHHDFRPILAEIEEHPTNPLGMWFLWTVIALMLAVLFGLYFIKVDVVISARGKLIPIGDVKIVQPLDTGVVTAIHVKEGDFVKEGDALLSIDPSVDNADLEGKEQNLQLAHLEMERVEALLDGRTYSPPTGDYPADMIMAQTAKYQSQLAVYVSTLQEKEKEIQEVTSNFNTNTEEKRRLEELAALVKEDEIKQKALVEIGALAENRYREKLKEHMNLEREINVKNGQLEQTAVKIERIKDEMETFRSGFREKLMTEFTTNMQKKNALTAEVSNLRFRQDKRIITAPVNGYIHQLPVKTVGGVVTTAQSVASIVPEKSPLEVNALVVNKDIGFVKESQAAVVKVDSYDFQKYGLLEGTVHTISPSSIASGAKENEKPMENSRIDPAASGYPVYIKLKSEELTTKDGKVFKVKAGMSVTTEINVGRRRVVEFFIFPVIRYLDEGLKVR